MAPHTRATTNASNCSCLRKCIHHFLSCRRNVLHARCSGVRHLQENALSQDLTVGLCLGSQLVPRGVGIFLWASAPVHLDLYYAEFCTVPSSSKQGYGGAPSLAGAIGGLRCQGVPFSIQNAGTRRPGPDPVTPPANLGVGKSGRSHGRDL